nr:MAG TPA: hypothetical protein [Caudoviricetes sp.]
MGTPDIGRSGIFCTSLRVREVSDCLSFFIWYNIIDKHTHISPKNIRTFCLKLYITIILLAWYREFLF